MNQLKEEFPLQYVKFIKCDVTKLEEIQENYKNIFNDFSKIQIIVNVAGVMCEPQSDLTIGVNVV